MHDKCLEDVLPPNYSELFNIEDTLKFTIHSLCETVELLDIDINFETMAPYLKVRLQHALKMIVTKDHLSPQDTKDLFRLPITVSQV